MTEQKLKGFPGYYRRGWETERPGGKSLLMDLANPGKNPAFAAELLGILFAESDFSAADLLQVKRDLICDEDEPGFREAQASTVESVSFNLGTLEAIGVLASVEGNRFVLTSQGRLLLNERLGLPQR